MGKRPEEFVEVGVCHRPSWFVSHHFLPATVGPSGAC